MCAVNAAELGKQIVTANKFAVTASQCLHAYMQLTICHGSE